MQHGLAGPGEFGAQRGDGVPFHRRTAGEADVPAACGRWTGGRRSRPGSCRATRWPWRPGSVRVTPRASCSTVSTRVPETIRTRSSSPMAASVARSARVSSCCGRCSGEDTGASASPSRGEPSRAARPARRPPAPRRLRGPPGEGRRRAGRASGAPAVRAGGGAGCATPSTAAPRPWPGSRAAPAGRRCPGAARRCGQARLVAPGGLVEKHDGDVLTGERQGQGEPDRPRPDDDHRVHGAAPMALRGVRDVRKLAVEARCAITERMQPTASARVKRRTGGGAHATARQDPLASAGLTGRLLRRGLVHRRSSASPGRERLGGVRATGMPVLARRPRRSIQVASAERARHIAM